MTRTCKSAAAVSMLMLASIPFAAEPAQGTKGAGGPLSQAQREPHQEVSLKKVEADLLKIKHGVHAPEKVIAQLENDLFLLTEPPGKPKQVAALPSPVASKPNPGGTGPIAARVEPPGPGGKQLAFAESKPTKHDEVAQLTKDLIKALQDGTVTSDADHKIAVDVAVVLDANHHTTQEVDAATNDMQKMLSTIGSTPEDTEAVVKDLKTIVITITVKVS